MEEQYQSQQNELQSDENTFAAEGRSITQEQLSDMFFAGTSDGLVQLENRTIELKQNNNK
ncbi:hypothetical protein [Paenibacillus radicis (ex Xue et al. 2023)]|uniref:DUF4025 domain-containing protein n=1 Tax=Paenibacillus radicis (ex Xue et al. 2023) TaxID=2972489 RepID=A0ABT1YEQ3_9BACL|nr:hypothetical protein [Paenibacillus radicis (ex Xue et al. 2023)]MCR8630703.1 hypothetical protein [Paenibacillus radicis (ex Xue et al. 2023)]